MWVQFSVHQEEPTVATVSIRDLANNASKIVNAVKASGKSTVVTKHGRPVAALVPIDDVELEDFVLSNAPEFVLGRATADTELVAGTTRSLDAVLTDLDGAS